MDAYQILDQNILLFVCYISQNEDDHRYIINQDDHRYIINNCLTYQYAISILFNIQSMARTFPLFNKLRKYLLKRLSCIRWSLLQPNIPYHCFISCLILIACCLKAFTITLFHLFELERMLSVCFNASRRRNCSIRSKY